VTSIMTNHLEAEKVAEHRLEHVQLGEVRISVYDMAGELATMLRYGNEHAAKLVPVRVQSACAYGEVLGAADCDCKTQLDEAFKMFKDARCGILIYLNQEGRGAGLAVKARAYELQDREQLDTVQAYERLGVDVDQRRYDIAASILRQLDLGKIKLLTNNERKIQQLVNANVSLERQPLTGAITRHNLSYLRVKRDKLGHMLDLQSSVRPR